MTIPFEKVLEEQLATDPEFRAEYEKQKPLNDLVIALIKARKKAGLTQEQVAARMHTTQSVVARLETGGSKKPSLELVARYAQATGNQITISPMG
ncbi:helix-turn-helix domain-containing protein [Nisaea sediminum]|uniref:helix-turn-helix domain-containing protein n=1 Tax=Nisaea sediminum TaxID=2775867 RepID=UPI0018691B1C|nr:helix-turn-helix transcriptional regulator [Nisaea sediminum]